MLDQPRGPDYTIWVVAFALYLCDAAKLVAPRELLLVEAAGRRLTVVFSGQPFTIAGRVLAFPPVLFPYRAVFVVPWARPWSDGAALKGVIGAMDRLRASLGVVRVLAACVFALLFIAGPGLTFTLGPDAAVLYTAALLYPTVLAAAACLWWKRGVLQLTRAQCAWLSAEILVCPAFGPNLVRKITARHRVEADAAQMLLATASVDTTRPFLAKLERRTEELIEETEEAGAVGELSAYLATIRGAR